MERIFIFLSMFTAITSICYLLGSRRIKKEREKKEEADRRNLRQIDFLNTVNTRISYDKPSRKSNPKNSYSTPYISGIDPYESIVNHSSDYDNSSSFSGGFGGGGFSGGGAGGSWSDSSSDSSSYDCGGSDSSSSSD